MRLSEPEQLLLHSVNGDISERERAWALRQKLYPIHLMPAPADQLLSYVAAEYSFDDADKGRLRGIQRHTWLANQTRLDAARKVVICLRKRGVAPVWLDDLALAVGVYASVGQRSIQELCAWVPDDQLAACSLELELEGYARLHLDAREAVLGLHGHVLRLVGHAIPNRTSGAPLSVEREGFEMVNPISLFLRLCARSTGPRHGLWLLDLMICLRRLDRNDVKLEARRQAVVFSVWRAVRALTSARLSGDWESFAPPLTQAMPGEWFEAWLGARRFTAYILAHVPKWTSLPLGLVRFSVWRLKEASLARSLRS